MYRCIACDAPAQPGCGCPLFPAVPESSPYDPWGWKDESKKLDIQSGLFVQSQQQDQQEMMIVQ